MEQAGKHPENFFAKAIQVGSYQKKVQTTKRNRVLKKKLGFFALCLNMSLQVL